MWILFVGARMKLRLTWIYRQSMHYEFSRFLVQIAVEIINESLDLNKVLDTQLYYTAILHYNF